MEKKRDAILYVVHVVAGIMAVAVSIVAATVFATDYSSSHFIVRDPVVSVEGGLSTSTHFQYLSTTGQTVIGESIGSSFTARAGFLYFPSFVSAPLVTATAGTEAVGLSWTAASGSVAVDHYLLGTAASSGAETYETVGNVTSFTKSGLTGGTTYYFTVQAVDSSDTVTITSSEVSATPTAAITAAPAPSGGGGFIAATVGASALPIAPRAQTGEALDTHTIRWYFEDRATNETGFQIRDAKGNVRASTPPWVSSDLRFLDERGLPANKQVSGRSAVVTNVAGVSNLSATYTPVYTLIEQPGSIEATVSEKTGDVYVHARSNGVTGGFSNLSSGASGLLFENVSDGATSGWVKAETYLFANLVAGKTYQFRVRARNGDAVETASSPLVTVELPAPPAPPTPTTPPLALLPAPKIIEPIDGSTFHRGNVSVRGQSEPFARVRMLFAGVSSSAVADEQGFFSFELKDLRPGTYTLAVSATRRDGRRSETGQVHFAIVRLPSPTEAPPTVTPVVPPVLPPSIIVPVPMPTEIPNVPALTLPRIEQITNEATKSFSTISNATENLGGFVVTEAPRMVTNFGEDVRSLLAELAPSGQPTLRTVAEEGSRQVIDRIKLAFGIIVESGRAVIGEVPRLADRLQTDISNRFAALPPEPSPRPFFVSLFEQVQFRIRVAFEAVVAGGRIVAEEVSQLASQYRLAIVTRLAEIRPPSLPSPRPFIVAFGNEVNKDVAVVAVVVEESGAVITDTVPRAYQRWQSQVATLAARLRPPSPEPLFAILQENTKADTTALRVIAESVATFVAHDVPAGIGETRARITERLAAIEPPSPQPFFTAFEEVTTRDSAVVGKLAIRAGSFLVGDVPAFVGAFGGKVATLVAPLSPIALAPQPTTPSPLVAPIRPTPTAAPATLPVDTIVAKAAFGDYRLLASADNELRLPTNFSFKMFIKPSRPVEKVTANLVLTQVNGRSSPEDVPSNLFLMIPQANAMTIPEAQALALPIASFPYRVADEAGVYTTFITVPPLVGSYQLQTKLAYVDGPSKTITTKIVAEDAGYVYSLTSHGQQERIRNAVVTLYVERSDTNGFTIWPGARFDQVNPTYTDETGSYQFLPSPGRYRLVVEQPDYERYESAIIGRPFTAPIARPIELKPRGGIFSRTLNTLLGK